MKQLNQQNKLKTLINEESAPKDKVYKIDRLPYSLKVFSFGYKFETRKMTKNIKIIKLSNEEQKTVLPKEIDKLIIKCKNMNENITNYINNSKIKLLLLNIDNRLGYKKFQENEIKLNNVHTILVKKPKLKLRKSPENKSNIIFDKLCEI